MVATRESKHLAERLLADTITQQRIDPGQLTLHADCGSSMASKPARCCWPTSASPSPTAGPTSATTTHSPKRSSRR
jgi:hypothetical protein